MKIVEIFGNVYCFREEADGWAIWGWLTIVEGNSKWVRMTWVQGFDEALRWVKQYLGCAEECLFHSDYQLVINCFTGQKWVEVGGVSVQSSKVTEDFSLVLQGGRNAL